MFYYYQDKDKYIIEFEDGYKLELDVLSAKEFSKCFKSINHFIKTSEKEPAVKKYTKMHYNKIKAKEMLSSNDLDRARYYADTFIKQSNEQLSDKNQRELEYKEENMKWYIGFIKNLDILKNAA